MLSVRAVKISRLHDFIIHNYFQIFGHKSPPITIEEARFHFRLRFH